MEQLGADDPQVIGGYRLLGRLGVGGMGQVYLARSGRGRTVAVKLVRRDLAEREEFRARFRQEVGAARRVGGDWTAPVLDADTEAEIPWVATGYVAGPSLESVVGREHGPLPESTVRSLAAGLAGALRDIHAAGLIHRDLKPSNVLVTIDGPRVIDFGIARALESAGEEGITRTGALVGSPGFMAPEQVRGDPITPACDVFCLGSLLAYAATGTLPFGAADSGAHAVMFRIAQEEPDLSEVPEGLVDLVRDCLHKDPARRPTPAQVLDRTGAQDTLLGGRMREPWLPAALVAQLGRHAVRLLEVEDPGEEPPGARAVGRTPTRVSTRAADGGAGATPVTASPGFGPPLVPAPVPVPPPSPHGGPVTGPVPPARPRSRRAATVALVAVALVVALGAGGAVLAVMRGTDDGGGTGRKGTHGGGGSASPANGSPSPDAGEPFGGGAVPRGYVGTWTASIDNDGGHSTRRLVVHQGKVGERVLSLIAEGPAGGGTYHCEFQAALAAEPTDGGPVSIGPSTVTVGRPATSCTPGAATELALLPDGRLRRTTTDGSSLTYDKES
ncbi:serine/threonine-protein kinase [Streptomyces griseoaurantiacus]|uniref:Serine-threonine protein kinase n=1 Tax=Streptomyces griseoaurantiacus M045 TaxID=996637 RepID=F3NMG5_9ACTN|nr:serine/threonine-protein kinase [Streptomyces griseoaurantiacus]EGG45463.1 serine-threonine protein kinase [Streptomyces griseoaurantiacus M045]